MRTLLAVVLVATGGCATRSDCVRADDALVAASQRLVGETPSVAEGDGASGAARKLIAMAEVLDEERARIAAMTFDDDTVAAAMRDYAEGLRRIVQTVRQTARATTTLAESTASLEVAHQSLTRSLDALESACEGVDPPCALSSGPLPKGSTKTKLAAVEARVEAIASSDPGVSRARADALRQLARVQELLAQVAEATAVVGRIGRELDALEAISSDVRSRLDTHCPHRQDEGVM